MSDNEYQVYDENCQIIHYNEFDKYPRDTFDQTEFNNSQELKIVCNDANIFNIYNDGVLSSFLLITARTFSGNNINILFDDIDYYFDIKLCKIDFDDTRVPDLSNQNINTIINTILAQLKNLNRNKLRIKRYEIIEKKWYREYELKHIYCRIYFYNITERDMSINYLYEHDSVINKDYKDYEFILGNDDRGLAKNIFKVGRDYHLTFSNTAIIKNYSGLLSKDDLTKFKLNKPTIRMSVKDFEKKSMDYIDPSIVMAWDIETTKGINCAEPSPNNKTQECFMVACCFYRSASTKSFSRVIITQKEFNKTNACDVVIVCTSECELISAFWNLIELMNIDFETTFNGSKFDMFWFIERSKEYRILPQLAEKISVIKYYCKDNNLNNLPRTVYGPSSVKMEAGDFNSFNVLKIPGITGIDMYIELTKTDKKAPSSTLNYFASSEGLGTKVDLPYQEMWDIYDKGDKDELRKVAYYNVIDSELCQRLLVKKNLLPLKRKIADRSFVTIKHAFMNADGDRLINLLAEQYNNRDYIMGFRRIDSDKSVWFEGAYVFPPKRGIYKDYPAIALDFESLYPNVIINGNKSHETVLRESTNERYFNHLKSTGVKFNKRTDVNYEIRTFETPTSTKPIHVDKRQDNGYFIDHGGDLKNMGVLPYLLRCLFLERLQLKNKKIQYLQCVEKVMFRTSELLTENMNTLDIVNKLIDEHVFPEDFLDVIENLKHINKNNINHLIDDILEKLNYTAKLTDVEQLGIKIFMNSYYGKTGDAKDCLSEVLISASTTSDAQTVIKYSAEIVASEGGVVRYGDTDSIYFIAPLRVFEDLSKKFQANQIEERDYIIGLVQLSIEYANVIKNIINDKLKELTGYTFLKLAYEECLFPYLLLSAKKYGGYQHMNTHNFDNLEKNMFVKGLSLIRRDSTKFENRHQEELFKRLLNPFDLLTPSWNIIRDYSQIILTEKRDVDEFTKIVKYKPTKKNVRVHTLVERYAKEGIIIQPYEKFGIVVISANYFSHTVKGNSIAVNIGERTELATVAKEKNMDLDIQYYIQGGITTAMAQYMSSNEKFHYTPTDLEKETCSYVELSKLSYIKEKAAAKSYILSELFSQANLLNVNNHKDYKNIYKMAHTVICDTFKIDKRFIKNYTPKKNKVSVQQIIWDYIPDKYINNDTDSINYRMIVTKKWDNKKKLWNDLFSNESVLNNYFIKLQHNYKQIREEYIKVKGLLPIQKKNIVCLVNLIKEQYKIINNKAFEQENVKLLLGELIEKNIYKKDYTDIIVNYIRLGQKSSWMKYKIDKIQTLREELRIYNINLINTAASIYDNLMASETSINKRTNKPQPKQETIDVIGKNRRSKLDIEYYNATHLRKPLSKDDEIADITELGDLAINKTLMSIYDEMIEKKLLASTNKAITVLAKDFNKVEFMEYERRIKNIIDTCDINELLNDNTKVIKAKPKPKPTAKPKTKTTAKKTISNSSANDEKEVKEPPKPKRKYTTRKKVEKVNHPNLPISNDSAMFLIDT